MITRAGPWHSLRPGWSLKSQCCCTEHPSTRGGGGGRVESASSPKLCLKGLSGISLNRYQMENVERSLVKVFSSKIETLLNITGFLRINPRVHQEPFLQG